MYVVEQGQISTLNKDQLSNLSVLSKIIERVVKFRLTDHLTSTKVLTPHQSVYTVNTIPLKQGQG